MLNSTLPTSSIIIRILVDRYLIFSIKIHLRGILSTGKFVVLKLTFSHQSWQAALGSYWLCVVLTPIISTSNESSILIISVSAPALDFVSFFTPYTPIFWFPVLCFLVIMFGEWPILIRFPVDLRSARTPFPNHRTRATWTPLLTLTARSELLIITLQRTPTRAFVISAHCVQNLSILILKVRELCWSLACFLLSLLSFYSYLKRLLRAIHIKSCTPFSSDSYL